MRHVRSICLLIIAVLVVVYLYDPMNSCVKDSCDISTLAGLYLAVTSNAGSCTP